MSRDRPTEPPRVMPDAQRGVRNETPKQQRQREEIERLKGQQGSAFLASFFNPFNRPTMRAPQFIRRGYESGILDDLNAFYARRPRPWRPARCAPKPNRKTLPRRLGLKAMIRRQVINATRAAKQEEQSHV